MTLVDPGGTFGAEVSVTVVGPGRVTGSIANGIDCPTRCYVRYTFENAGAPGAAAGLGLRAIPTPGARFVGWTFETAELATKGRGPDQCNPVRRAATQPSVNAGSDAISLPFGETNGTPPPGQEGFCATFATVPVAYKLVARFENPPPPPDSGIEFDAGAGDILFEATPAGSVAKQIGIASGYVYWKWEQGSVHGISYGFPGSTPTTVTNLTGSITAFEVDSSYVVYQPQAGSVFAIAGGGTFSQTMTGSSTYTCVAVTSDGSNVYCRTAGPDGSIVGWTTSGTGPVLYQTGVPNGTDLVVDTSYFFITNDAPANAGALYYTLKSSTSDAGPSGWTTLLSGRSNMRELEQTTTRNAWLEYDALSDVGSAWVNTSKFSSTAFQIHPLTTGLKYLAVDPSNSSTVWLATGSQILRGQYGLSAATPHRSGTNIGGIAVDTQYVYWTQGDGRVYRATKF